jgi:transposase-like protein
MKNQNIKGVEISRTKNYEMLEGLVREKVQGFIQDILEEEVSEFFGREKSEWRSGRVDMALGYRNGYGKPRKLSLMSGTVTLKRPRVRGTEVPFESRILPLFKRRTKEVSEMIPELYLHGLATGDFELALRGLLGEGAPLSVGSLQRLKAKWQLEYESWKKRDVSSLKIVYLWADGLYVKAGLEKDKAALLVIIGVDTEGRKHIVACESGYRESKESWSAILRDLKSRGLKLGRLTIADGHLGIWAALLDNHPEGEEQRCWNHKIVNVLDRLPKRLRAEAGERLGQMPYAETQVECEKMRDDFVKRYQDEQPKACEILMRDWERMVTFYSFPKEHWTHIRTTNVVESPFNAIRLRTNAVRRYKKVQNATAMIWKLLLVAEKRFRTLKCSEKLEEVYDGRQYKDGIAIETGFQLTERIAA